MMWDGKRKSVTFSFDDGVLQDERAIEILNRHGLKATFNLNSSLLGLKGTLTVGGVEVDHSKIRPDRVGEVYRDHEVAVHTLTHPLLPALDDATIVWQVEQDRRALSALCGREVVGMAYPCGGVNHDERVAQVLRARTGVSYSRTITSTHDFAPQQDLLCFNPSAHYVEGCLFDVAERFLRARPGDVPLTLYIWGHTYEMDADCGMNWQDFDRLCALLGGRKEIFYGTNAEVLLGK